MFLYVANGKIATQPSDRTALYVKSRKKLRGHTLTAPRARILSRASYAHLQYIVAQT